jgi:glycosyltransferase involved in cell wall biosynthesis
MPGTGKKRIMIIGPSPTGGAVGGVASHVRTLKSFSIFHDAHVFDPGSVNGSIAASRWSVLTSIIALRDVLRQWRPEIVMVNASIYPSSMVKLLLILQAMPVGSGQPDVHVFFHGGRFRSLPAPVRAALTLPGRRVFRRAACFHFLSRVQRDEFSALWPDRPIRMYMNYSTSDTVLTQVRGVDPGVLRLLFVGRVVREKGIYELLEALEVLHKRLPEGVHLTIVGDGPALEGVRQRINVSVCGTVEVTGTLNGPALEERYSIADVLVLPSHAEAFPYTIVEAFRAGLPVIASATGAVPDLVKEGETGTLVAPGRVDQLVEAIARMHGDREGLMRMAACCHDRFLGSLSRTAGESYYSKLITQGIS